MAKKICLLSDLHICINPRVWKEAFFYEKRGYQVVVLTQWISDKFLDRDMAMLKGHDIRYEAYLDMRPGKQNPVSRFFFRLRKRIALELQKKLGIDAPYAVSYAPDLLTRRAARENADMYIGHTEVGFFAGKALQDLGYKVGFDMEDWHSEDYLVPGRPVRLLRAYEKNALSRGVFVSFPSKAMADAVQEKHGIHRHVDIVYNSFPEEEAAGISPRLPGAASDSLRLIWTSRTIGPGRGLETLLPAIERAGLPIELHLLGDCPQAYRGFLERSWRGAPGSRMIFHDFIPHHALLAEIARYDLGVAIEQPFPESRNKTVTNKMLQYLQAGIKVLATDTDGQREIADLVPGGIYLVSPGNPEQWSEQLRKAFREKNVDAGAGISRAYREYFSWTKQEEKLGGMIQGVLPADFPNKATITA